MYRTNEHFKDVMRREGYNLDADYTEFTRLSANAGMFGTGSSLYVIYEFTIVFKLADGKITMDNGGWQTKTSKRWINYGFTQTYLNRCYVNQKNFSWYLNTPSGVTEYQNNVPMEKINLL